MRLLLGRPIELLCLDLDDTIIDTEAGAPGRFAAAIRQLKTIRPDISPATAAAAAQRGLLTHPTEGRIANFLSDLGLSAADEITAVRDAYFNQMLTSLTLVTGAIDVLREIREHFRVAIVTNGPSDLQRAKIDRFGLADQVDWIVVSGEVGSEKPQQGIFEHVMGLARVEAQYAAHVGDSLVADIAGANSAGFLSIWVRSSLVTTAPSEARLTPHATINHIGELLGLAAPA